MGSALQQPLIVRDPPSGGNMLAMVRSSSRFQVGRAREKDIQDANFSQASSKIRHCL